MTEINQPVPLEASNTFPQRATRRDTNWIAVIRTSEGIEIPCNVKDASNTGARLGIPAAYHLPETFMLKVVGKDYVCRVKLAWRKGNYAGVRIEQIAKIAPKPIPNAETGEPQDSTNYKAIGTRRSKVSSF